MGALSLSCFLGWLLERIIPEEGKLTRSKQTQKKQLKNMKYLLKTKHILFGDKRALFNKQNETISL